MKKQHNLLTPSLDDDGYEVVVLKDDKGNVARKQVHYLVAEAFVPNPNNFTNIRHIDGNILNNRADNLEWCA